MEARFSEDDKWYAAEILQVIHRGYDIARCDTHIKRLKAWLWARGQSIMGEIAQDTLMLWMVSTLCNGPVLICLA